MNKTIKLLLLSGIVCCSLFALNKTNENLSTEKFFSKYIDLKGKAREEELANIKKKMNEYIFTLLILKKSYFKDYNISTLIQKSIKGLINNELDPHSHFFTNKEYKKFMEETKGNYIGIGILVGFDKKKGLVKVLKVFKNGPAYKVGIKSGDYIVKINGKIAPTNLEGVVNKIKGKENTDVNLTVYRHSKNKYLNFTVTRKKIKIPTFEVKIIDGNIGYLKINSFNEIEEKEIKQKLEELKKKGIKGLIIDLRDNPGGLLTAAIETVNMFINDGKILSIKGRLKRENKVYYAEKNKAVFPKLPLVILVNGNTASASEIVSGALQYHKRAIIIGTKTFGKGSVQTFVPLLSDYDDKNFDVAKITVARYFLPNGKSIQGEGITPNIIIKEGNITVKNDNTVFKESTLKNSDILKVSKDKLEKKEKINYNESEFYKDLQLYTAIQVLKGLIGVSK